MVHRKLIAKVSRPGHDLLPIHTSYWDWKSDFLSLSCGTWCFCNLCFRIKLRQQMEEGIERSSVSDCYLAVSEVRATHLPPAAMVAMTTQAGRIASVGREAANDLRAFPSGWYVWRKLRGIMRRAGQPPPSETLSASHQKDKQIFFFVVSARNQIER